MTVLVTHQHCGCCWTVSAQHPGFLCFPLYPPSRDVGEDRTRTADPKLPTWCSIPRNVMGVCWFCVHLPKQPLCMLRSCLTRKWSNISLLMAHIKFFILPCLHAQCSLHLLNCIYLNPQIFLPSAFSPCYGEGEWASNSVGACLLAHVNPIRSE